MVATRGRFPGATSISVVSPQPVVERGITSLLSGRHGHRMITTRDLAGAEPDVVFYDVINLHGGDGSDLDRWVRGTASLVIAVTHELRPDLGALALSRGARAAISVGASEEDYVEVVEAALQGRLQHSDVAQDAEMGTRVGGRAGLTLREADVLALIVRGVSNNEIATELCLSINSVKSYIRSAYRKMEVTSRAQAVNWGVQHGFALDGPRSAPASSARPPRETSTRRPA